jgi:perosamine synthetase
LNIALDAPNVGELEKKYLNQVIDHGFISTFGPFIPDFEKKIATTLGVKAAVAVQSGTAAIYLALHELGIGIGDEVIVPSLTFIASINPILYTGATPVIVDVDPFTWNIDPLEIQKAITSKTKAIVPVHLYGSPCDMPAIMAIAKEHGLYVIEDATESLGAKIQAQDTGTFGNFGCLSFNGNKLISTGGGGMVVGDDVERIEHIRYLANQAKDKTGFHTEMGFNFRMTNIEAALGLAQFERLPEFIAKKKAFKAIYQDALQGVAGITVQGQYPNTTHSGWLHSITIAKDKSIELLMSALAQQKIPTRRLFMPAHYMGYLKKFSKSCPQASGIYERGLCLPSSTLNETADIKTAANIIKEAYGTI